MLSRYLLIHGSITAQPDSPPFGATIVLAVVAAMALSVLVFRPERGELWSLVKTSAAWSITLLLALIVAWWAIAGTERQNRWHGTLLTSDVQTDAYLAGHLAKNADPIRIPTGVMIQSMEFLSGDDVQVSGYIWQRYGPDVPSDVERGVVLAEAVQEAYDTTEAYRYEENGVETVGWYFARQRCASPSSTPSTPSMNRISGCGSGRATLPGISSWCPISMRTMQRTR